MNELILVRCYVCVVLPAPLSSADPFIRIEKAVPIRLHGYKPTPSGMSEVLEKVFLCEMHYLKYNGEIAEKNLEN